jgi:hypothetical protein
METANTKEQDKRENDKNDKQENDKLYILGSIKNIDSFINKNEYRKAFGLLILVLERLDADQKHGLIDYYSKNLEPMGILRNSRL